MKWRVVVRRVGEAARVIECATKRAAEAEAALWDGMNPEIVHPKDWPLYAGVWMVRS